MTIGKFLKEAMGENAMRNLKIWRRLIPFFDARYVGKDEKRILRNITELRTLIKELVI